MSLNFGYQAYHLLLLLHIITPQCLILISNKIELAGLNFEVNCVKKDFTDSKILLEA